MRKGQKLLLGVAFIGFAVPPMFACGGGNKDQPPPQGSYNTWQNGAQQQPPPGNTMGGPQPVTVGGGQQQPPPGGTMAAPPATTGAPPPGGTASAPPPGGVAVDPAIVQTLLTPLASKYAPGMQPEGAPLTANLAEGQKQSITVTMTGGKCYTIIGASPIGVGVKDLNVELWTPPLYTMNAGKDGTTSNEAVIGKAPNPTCPLLPLPVAYRLDVTAAKGAGPVAVQVYSKTK